MTKTQLSLAILYNDTFAASTSNTCIVSIYLTKSVCIPHQKCVRIFFYVQNLDRIASLRFMVYVC